MKHTKSKPSSAREKLPRFNHYVPQFILRRFAHAGKICIFDKHTKQEFKLPTDRAMGEKDYNNVHFNDAVVSFENKFTHLENIAAPIIAKIIGAKNIDFLTPTDTAALHCFLIVQYMRSKSRRLDQDAIMKEIRRRWPEAPVNPQPDLISDFELTKYSALQMTFNKMEDLVKPLVFKHMFLMVRDCKEEVYISDNPLVMHNQNDFGPYGNIGIAVPGIEIYYPLSPDLVLALICPTSLQTIEEAQREAEKTVSSYFASKVISAVGISQNEMATWERHRNEIRRSKDYYRLMKDKRLVPMDSKNLLFLNSLQLSSSHRFIAAIKSDFHFARKALAERPHWKEGIRLKVA